VCRCYQLTVVGLEHLDPPRTNIAVTRMPRRKCPCERLFPHAVHADCLTTVLCFVVALSLECDSDGKEDIPTHAQIRRTALTPQPPSTLPPKPAVQVVVTQPGDVMVPGTKRGPDIIWEGDIPLKFPYSYAGAPKKRWFQVVSEAVGKDAKKIEKQRKEFDKVVAKMAGKGGRGPLPQVQSGISLVWSNPKAKGEKPRSMLLCEVTDLRRGHRTPVFWQHVSWLCLPT
jgi:hypothetical protein